MHQFMGILRRKSAHLETVLLRLTLINGSSRNILTAVSKRTAQILALRWGALSVPLRANIPETPVVLLINEQGEKEKG